MGRPIPPPENTPSSQAQPASSGDDPMAAFVDRINENLLFMRNNMRPVLVLDNRGRVPNEFTDVVAASVIRGQLQELQAIGNASMAFLTRQLNAIDHFERTLRPAAIASYVHRTEYGLEPPALSRADENALQEDLEFHLRRLEMTRSVDLEPDEDDAVAGNNAGPAPSGP